MARPRRNIEDAPIYRLELDLILQFTPPMSETYEGLRMTRSIELPFVPSKHIAIHSRKFDEICHPPMGFRLRNIIWDVDRQVFLAETIVDSSGPLAMIAEDVAFWLERGWKFGSYADAYKLKEEDAEVECVEADCGEDDDDMESWQSLVPSKRPKGFNREFKSLVRMLVELDMNHRVAYAMAKTQLFFDEFELQRNSSPAAKKFTDALAAFDKLPDDNKQKWAANVKRRYPRLQRLVKKSIDSNERN